MCGRAVSPDGPSYFESDIILTEDQRAAIEGENGEPFDPHEPQRAITRRGNRFWSDGKVPYAISSSLGEPCKCCV